MVPIDQLLSPDVLAFIQKNKKTIVADLMLRMPDFNMDGKWVAAQIEGWQKATLKLPYLASQEQIIYPIRLSMEQCSSERTGLYKSGLLKGNVAVDLTGGFGVDSYFFSKSFNTVIYIEQQEELAQIVAHNFKILKQHNISVHVGNSDELLSTVTEKVDLIYLDPARRRDTQKVFKLSDCEPNVIELQDFYHTFSDSILIKTSPMLDIAEALRQLKGVKEIHIVSVDNECKEVLYLLNKNYTNEPMYVCIHDFKKNIEAFTFKQSLENTFKATLSEPLIYLYEPNASILKAGAFNSIAEKYGVYKLHTSSHLYTSDDLIADFPGRIFSVKKIAGYNKKEIQSHVPTGKANIQARNFPDSVEEIRKKTGLKDGGSTFIFATTLQDFSKVLLICEKI
jgi:16S rRNA G966 N2-methylase RsmD